jgi:hypothetical protein
VRDFIRVGPVNVLVIAVAPAQVDVERPLQRPPPARGTLKAALGTDPFGVQQHGRVAISASGADAGMLRVGVSLGLGAVEVEVYLARLVSYGLG